MSVNTTRFRVRKAAGSPSVKGAGGIETLASHTCNPSAHPDYLRKGSLPQGFDRTEHLASKLDHCVHYLRRAEVTSSKYDYERTKTMNLTDSESNYAATKGTLGYVITSYVLNQVLTDLGLTDTSTFLKKSYIVTSSSTPPTIGLSSYVPGYDLFKPVYDQVAAWANSSTGIEATYMKKTDAVAFKAYPLTRKIDGVSTACTLANLSSDASKTSGGTYVELELPSEIPVADINKYTYGILIKDDKNAVCTNPMVVYYIGDPDASTTIIRTTCTASCLISTHSNSGGTTTDGTLYFNPPYRWLFGPDNTWVGETTTGASNYEVYLVATPITYET